MSNSSTLPTSAALMRARDEFAQLLSIQTTESTWQKFFAENRYVLAKSLPLKLLPCDIVPMGRPGKSEPDFIIYPGSAASSKLHGIIELKTPDARVICQPRRNVLSLSSNAHTAIRQVLKYDQNYDSFAPTRRTLSFQSASHLFVIIGLTNELLSIKDALLGDLRTLFPPGIRFLGFDELFDNFNRELPKSIVVLTPRTLKIREAGLDEHLDELFVQQAHQDLLLHRLVQRQARTSLLDEMNLEPEDLEILRALETQTNARPSELNLTARTSSAYTRNIPSFMHPLPIARRFCPAGVGAFYGADTLETAVAELQYHIMRANEEVSQGPVELVDMELQHYVFRFTGRLATLSSSQIAKLALDPDNYDVSVQVGQHAINLGIHGLLYPSVRGPGLTAVIYRTNGINFVETRGTLIF